MRTIPSTPVRFDRFPSGYVNDIHGWGFNRETITAEAGKLLTLDIDFGSYCSLGCPHCFQSDSAFKLKPSPKMSFDQMKQLILDAKKLGLRSVKFLGEGEPFQTVSFLAFLRFLAAEGIIPLIFTHGHVVGDDKEVARWNKIYGVTTGEQLVEELYKLGASVMLGFNALDDDVQGRMVGRNASYVHVRNRALKLFVDAGFTRDIPTRLALSVNPIEKQNVNDALEIYKWARLRNMYVVITPNMMSGQGRRVWKNSTPSTEQLIDLYTEIYSFNIEMGLQSVEQLESEGISSYAGGHPCNQVASGLYIKQDGGVWSCPGSDATSFSEGNTQDASLEDIWRSSRNFKRAGIFNNGCIAKDGRSIPLELYSTVLARIKKRFAFPSRAKVSSMSRTTPHPLNTSPHVFADAT